MEWLAWHMRELKSVMFLIICSSMSIPLLNVKVKPREYYFNRFTVHLDMHLVNAQRPWGMFKTANIACALCDSLHSCGHGIKRWPPMILHPERKLRGVSSLLWWFCCNFLSHNARPMELLISPESWLEFLKDVPFPPSSSCSAMKITTRLRCPTPADT